MNIPKIQEYYGLRYAQFSDLANAEFWFDLKNDINMWEALFSYAENMYQAKTLFNLLDDDDIGVMLDGRVPMFIVEVEDDNTD